MFKKAQKGFTLIELLIVIAIIGILAAVIIPSASSFITSGHEAADKTEFEAMQTAAQGYIADNPNPTVVTQIEVVSYLSSGTVIGTYTFDKTGNILTAEYPSPITCTIDSTTFVPTWAK